jgi:hypothetical protein
MYKGHLHCIMSCNNECERGVASIEVEPPEALAMLGPPPLFAIRQC